MICPRCSTEACCGGSQLKAARAARAASCATAVAYPGQAAGASFSSHLRYQGDLWIQSAEGSVLLALPRRPVDETGGEGSFSSQFRYQGGLWIQPAEVSVFRVLPRRPVD